jgi:hypothetical protein
LRNWIKHSFPSVAFTGILFVLSLEDGKIRSHMKKRTIVYKWEKGVTDVVPGTAFCRCHCWVFSWWLVQYFRLGPIGYLRTTTMFRVSQQESTLPVNDTGNCMINCWLEIGRCRRATEVFSGKNPIPTCSLDAERRSWCIIPGKEEPSIRNTWSITGGSRCLT